MCCVLVFPFVTQEVDRYLRHHDFLNLRKKEILYKKWLEDVSEPLLWKIEDKMDSQSREEIQKRREEQLSLYLNYCKKKVSRYKFLPRKELWMRLGSWLLFAVSWPALCSSVPYLKLTLPEDLWLWHHPSQLFKFAIRKKQLLCSGHWAHTGFWEWSKSGFHLWVPSAELHQVKAKASSQCRKCFLLLLWISCNSLRDSTTQLSAPLTWISRAIRAVRSPATNSTVFYTGQAFVVSGNHCTGDLWDCKQASYPEMRTLWELWRWNENKQSILQKSDVKDPCI